MALNTQHHFWGIGIADGRYKKAFKFSIHIILFFFLLRPAEYSESLHALAWAPRPPDGQNMLQRQPQYQEITPVNIPLSWLKVYRW
jgi:hypothetical protein